MAYLVKSKGKYWELRESYRDERGRPRSRLLKYLGVMYGVPEISLTGFFTSEPGVAAAERAMEEVEARPEVEEANNLPPGLTQGPAVAVEVEKAPPSIDYSAPDAAPGEEGGEGSGE